jgi:hypothetical protein
MLVCWAYARAPSSLSRLNVQRLEGVYRPTAPIGGEGGCDSKKKKEKKLSALWLFFRGNLEREREIAAAALNPPTKLGGPIPPLVQL